MMYRPRTWTTAFLLVLAFCMPARAQRPEGGRPFRRRMEAGGLFSFKGCGLVADFPMRDGGGGEIRLLTDFEQILQGHAAAPGIRISFFRRFQLKEYPISNDLIIRISAGPGLTGGWVHDHEKEASYMAAASAMAGVDFLFFRAPVTVTAGLSADLGAHMVIHSRYDNTMTFYKNGLRRAWYPELTVKYRF